MTTTTYDFTWNPTDEAFDFALDHVRNDQFEPIICAGFRKKGAEPCIWFIQRATDDFSFWFGTLDTRFGDEMEESYPNYEAERIGFNTVKEIRRNFQTNVELDL